MTQARNHRYRSGTDSAIASANDRGAAGTCAVYSPVRSHQVRVFVGLFGWLVGSTDFCVDVGLFYLQTTLCCLCRTTLLKVFQLVRFADAYMVFHPNFLAVEESVVLVIW
jgi:hypothetical protein